MHLHVTNRTVFAGFQITHDAHFADCNKRTIYFSICLFFPWQTKISLLVKNGLTWVEAFNDGGCVYEVSSAQDADEVRIELSDLYPGRAVHVGTLTELFCLGKKRKKKVGGEFFLMRSAFWSLKQHHLSQKSRRLTGGRRVLHKSVTCALRSHSCC